jgi:hypothetical protein
MEGGVYSPHYPQSTCFITVHGSLNGKLLKDSISIRLCEADIVMLSQKGMYLK